MSSDESNSTCHNEQSDENGDDLCNNESSSVLSNDQQRDKDSYGDNDDRSDEDINHQSDENTDEESKKDRDEHNDRCISKCNDELGSVSCYNREQWLKSIRRFVQETGANSLDLSHRRMTSCEVLSVFESLINSQVTEVCFDGNYLANEIKTFSKILLQTKLKKLSVSNCNLTIEDKVQLMEAVKDSEITDLDISPNTSLYSDATLASTFSSHLLQSRITHLNIREFTRAEFARRLPAFSVTNLDPSVFMDELPRVKARSFITSLISNLQHTALKDLNLACNRLCFSELEQLSEILRDSKLERLNLSSNNLRDAGVNVLMRGLVHSKVIDLNLSYNEIEGHNILGHHLKHTRIKSLDLTGNEITNDEMFNFPDFLTGSSVSDLILRGCELSNEIGQKLVKSLKSTEVTKLDVINYMFGSAGISEFCESVKFTNITDVHLASSFFSPKMFVDLGDSLKESKLKYIHLCGSDKFLSSNDFADFIEKTKGSSVVSLRFSQVELRYEDTIAKSLQNTTFTHFDLELYEFHPSDVLSLGAAIKFTAITHLRLAVNVLFGDKEMNTLVQCLKGTQVVSLGIVWTSITSIGAKALADALKDTNLLYLDLNDNRIEDKGLYYLAEQVSSTFVTVLDMGCDKYGYTKPHIAIDTALWANRKKVQQLTDSFKRIVPETNSDIIQFDRYIDSDGLNSFLEDCLTFYKTIIEQPLSMTVLAEERSFSLSKSQITTLMLDEFPSQFAMFIGRSVEADVTQHINFLKRTEELGLNKLTELLLLNRPLYVIDEDQDILHPYIYKLMHQYKQPIVNASIELGGVEKIINYFANHEELEGASDIINLLCHNMSNSSPT